MSKVQTTPSGDEAIIIMPNIPLNNMKIWSDSSNQYFPAESLDEVTISYTASDGTREKTVPFSNILFEGAAPSGESAAAQNEPYFPIIFQGNTFNLYRFHPGVVKRCLAKNMPLDDAITAYYQKNPKEVRMYPDEFIKSNKKYVKAVEKMCASSA